MQLDEPSHDREPEPGAPVPAAQGRLHLIEGVPDPRELIARDPDSRVLHGDPHLVLVAPRRDRDAAAVGRELHGVGQEVHEDLLQPLRIGVDGGRVGPDRVHDVDVLGLRRDRDDGERLIHDQPRIRGDRAQLHASRFETGDVEQLVDEVREALRAPKDRFLVLRLLRREWAVHLAEEQPAIADDRGERRAQLVADHREELGLQLVQPAQLFVDLRQRARLARFLRELVLVLPHEARAFDEDPVAAAQREESHGRERPERVDGKVEGDVLAAIGDAGHRPHRGP